jgi:hypothetical protein
MCALLPLYEYIYITQQLSATMTSTSICFALDELFTDSNKSSFDSDNDSRVTDATSFEEANAIHSFIHSFYFVHQIYIRQLRLRY